MVAPKVVELLFYRGIGRQRGRDFGSPARVIGRTAIPFLRKYKVPAAKRVCAELLEFAVPELHVLLVVEKISKHLQRVCEDKLWVTIWVVVAAKTMQAESFHQNLRKNPIGREEKFLQKFLINHDE